MKSNLQKLLQDGEALQSTKEDENTWFKINNFILNLNDIAKTEEELLLVYSRLSDIIIRSMLSERSRLSGTAIMFFRSTYYQVKINYMPFVYALIKICHRSNKVFYSRGVDTLLDVFKNIGFSMHSKVLYDYANSINKNVKIVVYKCIEAAINLETLNGNGPLKAMIVKGVTDATFEVREICKRVITQYNITCDIELEKKPKLAFRGSTHANIVRQPFRPNFVPQQSVLQKALLRKEGEKLSPARKVAKIDTRACDKIKELEQQVKNISHGLGNTKKEAVANKARIMDKSMYRKDVGDRFDVKRLANAFDKEAKIQETYPGNSFNTILSSCTTKEKQAALNQGPIKGRDASLLLKTNKLVHTRKNNTTNRSDISSIFKHKYGNICDANINNKPDDLTPRRLDKYLAQYRSEHNKLNKSAFSMEIKDTDVTTKILEEENVSDCKVQDIGASKNIIQIEGLSSDGRKVVIEYDSEEMNLSPDKVSMAVCVEEGLYQSVASNNCEQNVNVVGYPNMSHKISTPILAMPSQINVLNVPNDKPMQENSKVLTASHVNNFDVLKVANGQPENTSIGATAASSAKDNTQVTMIDKFEKSSVNNKRSISIEDAEKLQLECLTGSLHAVDRDSASMHVDKPIKSQGTDDILESNNLILSNNPSPIDSTNMSSNLEVGRLVNDKMASKNRCSNTAIACNDAIDSGLDFASEEPLDKPHMCILERSIHELSIHEQDNKRTPCISKIPVRHSTDSKFFSSPVVLDDANKSMNMIVLESGASESSVSSVESLYSKQLAAEVKDVASDVSKKLYECTFESVNDSDENLEKLFVDLSIHEDNKPEIVDEGDKAQLDTVFTKIDHNSKKNSTSGHPIERVFHLSNPSNGNFIHSQGVNSINTNLLITERISGKEETAVLNVRVEEVNTPKEEIDTRVSNGKTDACIDSFNNRGGVTDNTERTNHNIKGEFTGAQSICSSTESTSFKSIDSLGKSTLDALASRDGVNHCACAHSNSIKQPDVLDFPSKLNIQSVRKNRNSFKATHKSNDFSSSENRFLGLIYAEDCDTILSDEMTSKVDDSTSHDLNKVSCSRYNATLCNEVKNEGSDMISNLSKVNIYEKDSDIEEEKISKMENDELLPGDSDFTNLNSFIQINRKSIFKNP